MNEGMIGGYAQNVGMGVPMMDTVQAPPSQEYAVLITRHLNGFTVKVGCKTVVFESADKMLSEIGRYYKNPAAVAQEYLKSAGC